MQCHLVVKVWLAGRAGGVQQHDPPPQTTESRLSCQNHNTDLYTFAPVAMVTNDLFLVVVVVVVESYTVEGFSSLSIAVPVLSFFPPFFLSLSFFLSLLLSPTNSSELCLSET